MSYVPNHRHDIFVSYAHVDDEALPGFGTRWVSTLVDTLRTCLAQQLGRTDAFDLWADHRLLDNEGVTPQIHTVLEGTAVLVVVLSPGYLRSEWCGKEAQAFLEGARRRRRADARIFVVERDQIADDRRPAAFADLRPCKFWEAPRPDDKPRVFGVPRPDEDFYRRAEGLARDLARDLERLRAVELDAATLPGGHGGTGDAGRPRVFLAESTDDLDARREEVRRYLEQVDVACVPERLYSLQPDEFARATREDLEGCRLFVQLLGPFPGRARPDVPQGYLRLQHEIATECGIPVLQWRDPDFDVGTVSEPHHRALLEGATVRAEGIEAFKSEVRRQALEPRREAEAPAGRPNAFVFVDSDQHDRDLANTVSDRLAELGADVSLPLTTGSPAEIREDLERNLRQCNGLIVVYGTSTAGWVREQLLQCRKVIYQRDTDLPTLALYEGPPEPKDPLDLRLRNLRVMNCRTGVDEAQIREFVRAIGHPA